MISAEKHRATLILTQRGTQKSFTCDSSSYLLRLNALTLYPCSTNRWTILLPTIPEAPVTHAVILFLYNFTGPALEIVVG